MNILKHKNSHFRYDKWESLKPGFGRFSNSGFHDPGHAFLHTIINISPESATVKRKDIELNRVVEIYTIVS